MGLLVFALTFLIVIVVFIGIWMMIGGDTKQEVVRRRMEAVRKAERRGDVSMNLKLARDEMLSSVPAVHRDHDTQVGTLWSAITGEGEATPHE